jgi:hypothetical protein
MEHKRLSPPALKRVENPIKHEFGPQFEGCVKFRLRMRALHHGMASGIFFSALELEPKALCLLGR